MLKTNQARALGGYSAFLMLSLVYGCGSSSNKGASGPSIAIGGDDAQAGASNPSAGANTGGNNGQAGMKNPSAGANTAGSSSMVNGVSVAPAQTAISVGDTLQFTAVVDGSSTAGVSWSVKEADGGTVSDGGLYTASAKPGTFHVVATSKSNANASGSAEVVVSAKSGVEVLPRGVGVPPGATVNFSCTIDGAADAPCSWAVQEAGGGSVTPSGAFTAPATSGLYHVMATSSADHSKVGTGTVWVLPAGTGTSGEWTDQTPNASVQFNDVQSILVDPLRQNDLYSFVDNDGYAKGGAITLLKSTDYGVTWTPVSATKFGGLAWGAAIDPNPMRDPGKPPTMYSPAGYGNHGVWKSIDGGVTWTQLFAPGSVLDTISAFGGLPDAYSITVLSDNPPNHILITFHGGWKDSGDAGLAESTDGGVSWVLHPPPASFGISNYIVAIDASTWLVLAQDNGGANGMWKTATAGRVGGVISAAAWKRVDTLEHPHGSFQPVVTPDGVYVAGYHGIKRSKDKGDTWVSVYDFGGEMSSVVATGNFLYSNHLTVPNLVRASLQSDTNWASYATTPAGFIKGAAPFGTAVCSDGTHWYMVVDAGDSAKIWRYTE
jgi:hypothetical protein